MRLVNLPPASEAAERAVRTLLGELGLSDAGLTYEESAARLVERLTIPAERSTSNEATLPSQPAGRGARLAASSPATLGATGTDGGSVAISLKYAA